MTTLQQDNVNNVNIVVSSRYQVINQLGNGSMGAVYRTLDRLTGQTVALKRVLGRVPNLQANEATALLAQEFKVLASLRHPNIISVLDYGFDLQGQPYYIMPLLERARELLEVAQKRDLDGQIDLLLEVLQALAYLHRRGILHRDLKPANVLVDAQGQVKLVDFGLAVDVDEENAPAGTLAYMPPEVLSGKRSIIQSDLYTFGVIAYELFVGRRPFNASTPIALIYKILHEPLKLQSLTIRPELIAILQKLLASSIEDRYATAEQVIQAICEATGRPPALETHATRESFLQASRFIGREAEIARLTDALDRAREGTGGAWLVGGESGVGKSRLLDELQTQALLKGALVLRGQGIAEGGLPYQIWREAIRRLSLQTELSDFEASVLKPLVPDLDRLLGREIPDTPQIDTQSMQLRLLSVVELIFRQQQQLILLLLEDLQWAEDSLVILRRLSELANRLPLLIIGTYRNDERPTLPTQLSLLQHIKLERLSTTSIELLSVSMLGEAGKSQTLVEFLQHETEGNVFFIVEVVRALAEEAGQLADVGRKTLPEHIFVGGMETVVRRRLAKVPDSARRLMTVAAVAGRELDLKVLACIMPDLDLDDWLQQVATVIDVQDDRYRFAHDKLREGILAGLEADDRCQIHGEVAQAIETIYPASPLHYAALAYHWGQAQEAAKTIQYATLAGKEALLSGGYRDAIQFFEQALSLSEQAHLDNRQLSNLYYLLGDANWGQSELTKSCEAHVKALRLLGYSVPDTRRQLVLGAIRPLLRHGWRHVFHPRRHDQHPELVVAAGSFHQIMQGSYHDANFLLGLYSIFNGMDAAERAGDSSEAIRLKVRYYMSLGFALGDISLHTLARPYIRLAEKYLSTHSDPEMLAWPKFLHGLSLAGRGRWEQANRLLAESTQLSHAAGSLGLWVEINQLVTFVLVLQSRFAEALACIDSTSQVAARDGHLQAIGRLHLAKSRLLFLQGKIAEARQQYFDNEHAIEASLKLGNQTLSRIGLNGLLIDLFALAEDWDTALKCAETLTRLVIKAQTVSFVLAGEASTPLALYLTLWENQGTNSYRHLADTMLSLFHRKYTRHYEIGQPVEYMYRCWYHWLAGNEKQARTIGALAIQTAQTYKMPYYEAAARYHLARFMPKDDPERIAHLETALNLFKAIGAEYNAELVLQCNSTV